MKKKTRRKFLNLDFSRRVAAGLVVLLLGVQGSVSFAASREFSLTIEEVRIKVAPDLEYKVFAFNGQVPGPLLHVEEGDDVTVQLTNNTSLPHTIHWHGVNQINSWKMDGVPGVTQKNVEPGDVFTYKFKVDRPGSLWYHCHVNVNEHVGIRGMWGPLVVEAKNPLPIEKTVTKQVVMMLSSWESEHADTYGQGSIPGEVSDYFSVNAKSFPASQPIRVKKGDVVRLRIYGAGGETHNMHLHGHDMLVTHKDGYALPAPYYADTISLGGGERYDAIVKMENPGLFIFHDHVDKQVTARGKHPGGPITVVEYEGVEKEPWYVWKELNYDPNFYYSESLNKGYGQFNHPDFSGVPLAAERKRRNR
jgi:FtsP/CotA-like multicopper oxidase with cupredoxin domain